jgi:prepilin-type N-terminal cleavage/methylation domain-containing protein
MIGPRAHPRRRRAFTLLESMATVTVLATLSGVSSLMILGAVDGYTDAATAAQLHAELSIALDRVVREIRMIELDRDADGIAPNIVGVGDDYLTWQDVDADVYALTVGGTVAYVQIDGGGNSVLLNDVSAITVKAFDEDDTELVLPLVGDECDDIRRISVEMTIQRAGVSESLRTKTFLRSTMRLGSS